MTIITLTFWVSMAALAWMIYEAVASRPISLALTWLLLGQALLELLQEHPGNVLFTGSLVAFRLWLIHERQRREEPYAHP